MTEITAAHRTASAAAPPGARLGDRLRLLPRRRRADADGARGRPLLEGVRQPDRAGQDPPDRRDGGMAGAAPQRRSQRSSRAASPPTSAAESRPCSPAPRRSRTATATRRPSTAYAEARAAVSATNSVELDVRTRSGRGVGAPPGGRRPDGDRAAERRPRARRGIRLLRRRPRGDRLPARRRPLQAREHVDRGGPARGGAVARRGLRPPVRRPPLGHLPLALPLPSPPARLRGCPRGREHALELAQGVDDRRKMADAYFQASMVAERTGHWVLSRNYAERAKNLFQELGRRADGRPAAQQPRRPEPPAREAARGDRAAEGIVRGRRRGRRAGRRRPSGQRPRDRAPAPGRVGCGRGERARGAAAPRRPRRLPRRDRPGADRARPLAARAGSLRRGGAARSAPPTRPSSRSRRSATAQGRGWH